MYYMDATRVIQECQTGIRRLLPGYYKGVIMEGIT